MADVEIYFSPTCGYCQRAMRLLDRKGVNYRAVNVVQEPAKRIEMEKRAQGRTTVPQIFIDGRHIGGCDELHALEAEGALDPLLAGGGDA